MPINFLTGDLERTGGAFEGGVALELLVDLRGLVGGVINVRPLLSTSASPAPVLCCDIDAFSLSIDSASFDLSLGLCSVVCDCTGECLNGQTALDISLSWWTSGTGVSTQVGGSFKS